MSETQASLSWTDNATNETAYVVEHRTNGLWEVVADDAPVDAIHFLDSALTPLTPWSFRVCAVNAGTYSEYSSIAALTTPAGVGDGIPGWWRLHYFGSGLDGSGDAAPGADPDADGASNFNEYFAGTSPTNSSDLFHIVSAAVEGADFRIGFSSVTGRVYRVQFAETLDSPWAVVIDDIFGTGSSIQRTVTNGATTPKSYYRVTLKF
jgi:hypothetical protein